MDVETMDEHQAKWAAAVGRFSIAMGQIEMSLVAAGRLLLGVELGKLSPACAIEDLQRRLPAVECEASKEFLACLPEADRLRDLRNTILHSPVEWLVAFEGIPRDEPLVITPDFDDSKLVPIYISVMRDKKSRHVDLDLDKVDQLAQEAAALAERMWWHILVNEWARREQLKPAP